MKKINLILCLVFGILHNCYANANEGAKVYFEKKSYQFYKLSNKIVGGEERRIWFQNQGDEPLIIRKIGNSAKNWLEVTQNNSYVLPGKWSFFTVRFLNSGIESGFVNKNAILKFRSNAKKASLVNLELNLHAYEKKIRVVRDSLQPKFDTVYAPAVMLIDNEKNYYSVDVPNLYSELLIVDNLVHINNDSQTPVRIKGNPERGIIVANGTINCSFSIDKNLTYTDGMYSDYWLLTFREKSEKIVLVTQTLVQSRGLNIEHELLKLDTVKRGGIIKTAYKVKNTGNSGVDIDHQHFSERSYEFFMQQGVKTNQLFPIYLRAKDSIMIPFEINTSQMTGGYIRAFKLSAANLIQQQNITLSFSGFAQSDSFPEITFDTTLIHRDIVYNGNGIFKFEYTNTGSEPLIIKVAKASGGAYASYSKEPLLPGENGIIEVRYNTKRMGPYNRAITLTTNSYPHSNVVLRIKGTVKRQE